MSHSFLIFGGAGFVGARIARELNSRAITYRVSKADVRSREKIFAEIHEFRPTHVINAAAKGVDPTAKLEPGALEDVNVKGALNVQAECGAGGVQRMLHFGSCFEYGSHEGDIEENFALKPSTPYAESKAEASKRLLAEAGKHKCATMVLRLFGIWGPGERPHRLVPQIIAARQTQRPLPLTHGKQVRDFTFVDDMAADIVSLALAPGFDNGVINVGSGEALPVLNFALSVARALKCEDLLQPGALPERPGEMKRLVASVKKLSTLIQMKPRTSIENGLRQMGVLN